MHSENKVLLKENKTSEAYFLGTASFSSLEESTKLHLNSSSIQIRHFYEGWNSVKHVKQ